MRCACGARGFSGGGVRWIFWGFVAIAGFFLVAEHRAHAIEYLPFILLAACPLLHLFHGHGGHQRQEGHKGTQQRENKP